MTETLHRAESAQTIPVPSRDGTYFHFVKVWTDTGYGCCTSTDKCGAAKVGKRCHAVATALDLASKPTIQEPSACYDEVKDPQDARRREIEQLREGAAFLREHGEIASAEVSERAASYYEYLYERDFPTRELESPDPDEFGPGPFFLAPSPKACRCDDPRWMEGDDDPFAMPVRSFEDYHKVLAL